jgi:hypothetical protein
VGRHSWAEGVVKRLKALMPYWLKKKISTKQHYQANPHILTGMNSMSHCPQLTPITPELTRIKSDFLIQRI